MKLYELWGIINRVFLKVMKLKDVSLLVFLSQLGLGVALPLGGFVVLGVWLRRWLDLGVWIVLVFTALGALMAIQGFINTLKTMNRMAKKPEEDVLSYNEHE